MEDVKGYVSDCKITFSVAKDYDQRMAVSLGATRTPEIFVIDRGGRIVYQGRVDDQYEPGVARKKVTQHDLRDAIVSLVEGRTPDVKQTLAVGCLIGRSRDEVTSTEVTYCRDIVAVLQKHCIECHREGEIGPFALDDFDEVVGWADMSLEVIDEGRMPPWHASPEHGSFANSRNMMAEEKDLLRRWVDAGMPYGDAGDLPPAKLFTNGWRLPAEPDLVIPMSERAFKVPADGTVEYQYYVVDPGFTEDKWVKAAEVIPGNASVVHHCIAFTRPPDGFEFRDIGLLSAFVPGQIRSPLPEGYAQKVPAGSRIVFQMHYTPTGTPTEDVTRLGLVFADPDEVTHEVFALGGVEQEFEIPPGAGNFPVKGSISGFPRNGFLLSVMPHMHLRGKSFEFRLDRGNSNDVLLEVPAYDFNWQHNYELTEPLPLDQVESLSFTAIFDNSEENPFNPDHTEHVTWGDQTWQEMAVTFVTVAQPIGEPEAKQEITSEMRRRLQKRQEERERRASDFADQYMKRFDHNGDGCVTSHELPDSVRIYNWWQLDRDGDQRITREEIYREAIIRGK